MSTPPSPQPRNLNTYQARVAAFNAMKQGGMGDRDAGIVAFPEVHPDYAADQALVVPPLPNTVPADSLSPGVISRSLAETDMRKDFVAQGMSPDTAKTLAGSARMLPESGNVVEYKKLSDKLKHIAVGMKPDPLEAALRNSQTVHDMQLIGASIGSAFTGGQQATFSALVGEKLSDSVHRLWPSADIREDDGTVKRKAVIPQAIKSLSLGTAALLLDGVLFQHGGSPNNPLRAEARRTAESLMESDYRDNMLTGQEVIEYWMHGDALVGTRLPEVGTPERATYDAEVREAAGQAFSAVSDQTFGDLALLGTALGGAVMDVIVDPVLWMGDAPVKAVGLTRYALPASSRARMTSAIAYRTGRLEHTVDALKDAKTWMKGAEEAHTASPSADNLAKMLHAQKTVTRLQAQMDAFVITGNPGEAIQMAVNPRIHPDHLRDVRSAYRNGPREARKERAAEFVQVQVRAAKKAVKTTEEEIARVKGESPDMQQVMFTPEQQGADLATLEARLREQITTRDSWKETGRWVSGKRKMTGGRMTAALDEGVNRLEPYSPSKLTGAAADAAPVAEAAAAPKTYQINEARVEELANQIKGDFYDQTGFHLSDEQAWERALQAHKDDLLDEQMGDVRSAWEGVWTEDTPTLRVPVEPEVALRPKADALKEVQDNIRRGIAQGADEDEIIQWEHTYTQLLNSPDEMVGEVTRTTRSVHDILYDAIHEQRRLTMSETLFPVADYSRADATQAAQRLAFGPDQREAAAEAARVLAAGGEIDDVAYHGMGIDLYNSSYGEVLRSQSGSAEARAAASTWLGDDMMNTKIEVATWQQTMAEKMGDRFARGLYPQTWNVRPAGMLFNIREPMRVLQSTNPRLYTRIHDGLNAQKFELTRMNEIFKRELTVLGVYREVKGSYVLDSAASEKFYDVMNLVPGSKKYEQALAGLSETERRSIRRLRQELDFVGDKLGLRDTDKYIEGYIDHVWDRNWAENGARMQEIRGLGASTEVRTGRLMDREGAEGFKKDLALALDNYASGASRKLHFEPMFKDMEAAKLIHLKNNPGDEWFAQYIDHMTNNFKGRPSTLGQWVDLNMASLNARMRAHEKVVEAARKAGGINEKLGNAMNRTGQVLSKLPDVSMGKLGRLSPGKLGGAMEAEGVRVSEFGSEMALKGMPVYNIGDASRTAMGVTALVYSSVLGGSGRYFPMAIATGLATTGSRYGIFNTLKGILTMATGEGRTLAKTAGLEKQWVQIMEDAGWTKLGKLATNMPTFNGVTVVGPSISATENLIRGWTFHAAIGDLMRKQGFKNWQEVVDAGMARAYLHESLRTTEEVNHLFGQLGKPPTFHRFSKSGSVAATQFLSFIPKQTEELMSQAMQNPGRIGEYIMISGYMQRVAARAGLDISPYVGVGYLPSSPDDVTSISLETMESLLTHGTDMANLAAGTGDAATASVSGDRLKRNLGNFIPLAVATHRFTRSVDVLRKGALVTEEGGLIYEPDLGGFQWDQNKSTAANLLESYSPEYLGAPEHPSEMAALKSGLNSPQQMLERTQYQALRTAAKNRLYRRRQIADALQVAVYKGDGAEFDRQMNKAIEEGALPPDLSSMIDRSSLEMVVPRLMREQLDGDQQMLDASQTLPQLEVLYQMKFGTPPGGSSK